MLDQQLLERFEWKKPCTFSEGGEAKGGLTNISLNFLDKLVKERPEFETAIYWEGNYLNDNVHDCSEIEWETCGVLVKKIANILKSHGIQKNDDVLICMPNLIQLPLSILAAARIGAVMVPIDPKLGCDSLSTVFSQSSARLLLCVDAFWQGAEINELKKTIDEALEKAESCSISNIIVLRHAGPNPGMPPPEKHILGRRPYYKLKIPKTKDRDLDWSAEFMKSDVECAVEWVPAEHVVLKVIQSIDDAGVKFLSLTTAQLLQKSMEMGKAPRKAGGLGELQPAGHLVLGEMTTIYPIAAFFGVLQRGFPPVIFEGVPDFPDGTRIAHLINKYKITSLVIGNGYPLDEEYMSFVPVPTLRTVICTVMDRQCCKHIFPNAKIVIVEP